MISYPPSLKAVGGARTGIAPVNLLDVLTLNNDLYLFSDRLVTGVASAIEGISEIPAVPPVLPIPPGQAVAWSLPTIKEGGTNLQPSNTLTDFSLSTAQLDMNTSSPFGGAEVWTRWSGFAVPPLPSGAVIQNIFPVLICNADGSNTQLVSGGASVDPHNPSPGGAIVNLDGTVGEVYGLTLGSTVADITNAVVCARIWSSLTLSSNVQTLSVSFVGIAIYYTLPGGGGSPGEPEIPASGIPPAEYLPWLIKVPQISSHRSLQTDVGSFELQNVSGDTLSRDFEKLMRRATLEGAFFVYRMWQMGVETPWIEMHGTLTVEDVGVDTVKLKGTQLINPAQDDTPMFQYSETCQLQWGGRRCGATGDIECQYSYQTCQVPERILVVLNSYEKNYGESLANIAQRTINRRRKI